MLIAQSLLLIYHSVIKLTRPKCQAQITENYDGNLITHKEQHAHCNVWTDPVSTSKNDTTNPSCLDILSIWVRSRLPDANYWEGLHFSEVRSRARFFSPSLFVQLARYKLNVSGVQCAVGQHGGI